MATLLLEEVNDSLASTYTIASDEEKRQVKQIIEDILRLWTQARTEASTHEQLRQKAIDFALHHKTFPLDWSHNKLTREELNAR